VPTHMARAHTHPAPLLLGKLSPPHSDGRNRDGVPVRQGDGGRNSRQERAARGISPHSMRSRRARGGQAAARRSPHGASSKLTLFCFKRQSAVALCLWLYNVANPAESAVSYQRLTDDHVRQGSSTKSYQVVLKCVLRRCFVTANRYLRIDGINKPFTSTNPAPRAICTPLVPQNIIASNALFPLLKVKVNRGRTIELNHLSGKYQKIGDCRDKGAQKFFTTIQCIEDKANL